MKIKFKFMEILMLLTCLAFTACGGGSSKSNTGNPGDGGGEDVEVPAGITGLTATISNETITISWTDPEFVFDHIEITRVPDGETPLDIAPGEETYTAASLVNGTLYLFTVRSLDSGGTVTSEASVTAKPGIPVYTAQDMDNVRNDLTGYYILMSDISLAGHSADGGWVPLGNGTTSAFNGTFDGNGHTISGITINRTGNHQGLFGYVGGYVKDLRLSDCDVNGTEYVGALAGGVSGEIRNCHITGNVSGTDENIGGLAGSVYDGLISGCSTSGTVSGGSNTGGLVGYNNIGTFESSSSSCDVSGNSYIGGLVGNTSGGTIRYSSATGSVSGNNTIGGLVSQNWQGQVIESWATGNVSGNISVGGLAGANYDAEIRNCYARGTVDGTGNSGGLAGSSTGNADEIITFSYATGSVSDAGSSYGGLTGYIQMAGSVEYSYYDEDTTGMSDISKGDPKSTAEMKQQSTFDDGPGDGTDDDWDFTSIWAIDTDSAGGYINDGYPYLINNASGN